MKRCDGLSKKFVKCMSAKIENEKYKNDECRKIWNRWLSCMNGKDDVFKMGNSNQFGGIN